MSAAGSRSTIRSYVDEAYQEIQMIEQFLGDRNDVRNPVDRFVVIDAVARMSIAVNGEGVHPVRASDDVPDDACPAS